MFKPTIISRGGVGGNFRVHSAEDWNEKAESACSGINKVSVMMYRKKNSGKIGYFVRFKLPNLFSITVFICKGSIWLFRNA